MKDTIFNFLLVYTECHGFKVKPEVLGFKTFEELKKVFDYDSAQIYMWQGNCYKEVEYSFDKEKGLNLILPKMSMNLIDERRIENNICPMKGEYCKLLEDSKKCRMVNHSDLCSMGGCPLYTLLGLTPPTTILKNK